MPYDDLMRALSDELESMEKGAASMERQMDKLIYENHELRKKVKELELEIVHLKDEVSYYLGG